MMINAKAAKKACVRTGIAAATMRFRSMRPSSDFCLRKGGGLDAASPAAAAAAAAEGSVGSRLRRAGGGARSTSPSLSLLCTRGNDGPIHSTHTYTQGRAKVGINGQTQSGTPICLCPHVSTVLQYPCGVLRSTVHPIICVDPPHFDEPHTRTLHTPGT